jgi:hypothetical protein
MYLRDNKNQPLQKLHFFYFFLLYGLGPNRWALAREARRGNPKGPWGKKDNVISETAFRSEIYYPPKCEDTVLSTANVTSA